METDIGCTIRIGRSAGIIEYQSQRKTGAQPLRSLGSQCSLERQTALEIDDGRHERYSHSRKAAVNNGPGEQCAMRSEINRLRRSAAPAGATA